MKKIKTNLFVLLIILLFSLLAEFCLSRYINWDLHAYHYYNGWAFLNHRLDIDIMPAIFRSYFNPLLDAANFALIHKFNYFPIVILFISGLKFGIFLFLAYKIYDLTIREDFKYKKLTTILCMFLCAYSTICFITKGVESTDMPIGIITLFALYLFLKTFYGDNIKKNYILIFFSSFLIGAAFGLKYTNISFCIALPLVVLLRYKSFKHPIKTTLLIIISMFSGFLLTDGFWLYTLWHKFHNPMFPYFNEIFHSPYADYDHVFNTDFYHIRPKNLFQFIFHPVLGRGLEFKCVDLKALFVFWGFIAAGIATLQYRNFIQKTGLLIRSDVFYFLFVLTILSYYANTFVFGNIRYILPLYCFFSLFVAILCFYFCCVFKKEKIFIPFLTFITFINLYVFSLGRGFVFHYWKLGLKPAFKVENFNFEDNSIVFCATTMASFIVPEQNKNAKYVFFAVPEKVMQNSISVVQNRHWNDFYTSLWLESYLSDLIKQDKIMYAVFSNLMLGGDGEDFHIYEEALKYYSNNKKKFTDCKISKIRTLDRIDSWPGPYLVCKIK